MKFMSGLRSKKSKGIVAFNIIIIFFIVLGGVSLAVKLSFFNGKAVYKTVQSSNYVDVLIDEIVEGSQLALTQYELDDSVVRNSLENDWFKEEIGSFLSYQIDGIKTDLSSELYQENLKVNIKKALEDKQAVYKLNNEDIEVDISDEKISLITTSLIVPYDYILTNPNFIVFLERFASFESVINSLLLWSIAVVFILCMYLIFKFGNDGFLECGLNFLIGGVILLLCMFLPLVKVVDYSASFNLLMTSLNDVYQTFILVLSICALFAFVFSYGFIIVKRLFLKMREKELGM